MQAPASRLPAMLIQVAGMTLLWTGVFFTMRRWFRLQPISPDQHFVHESRYFQFSILHLLILTSLVSLIIGLIRGARSSTADSHWSEWVLMVLFVVVFATNAVCVAWATLSVHGHRLKISAVMLISLLLGGAMSAGMYRHFPNERALPLWAHCALLLGTLEVTLVLVVSLLVVRSCGYRLVRKRPTPTKQGSQDVALAAG
jgi:cytochrome bd-type quinol oxidase subunit 2